MKEQWKERDAKKMGEEVKRSEGQADKLQVCLGKTGVNSMG